jgi:pyruvate/2-oxoglutarate/acetoin dehydrogenase E1 component
VTERRRPSRGVEAWGETTNLLTYQEARSRALFRELDANADLFLLGGTISLPFNPDDGLAERYGDRIVWPPISEFATAGIGVGAAMAGLRPLVAVSTASFIFYAWAPVVLEAANVRYLTGGRVKAPVVFHVMAGSRRGGGPQHEHTPQAMLQNVPGLRVLAPGTPADVDAAFHAALTGQDPTVIVDHVLLAGAEGPVGPTPARLAPTLVREGTDVLIVSYSLMLQRGLAAAAGLEREGIGVAVLDVPFLHPLPVEEVLDTVAQYGRVVFVDESRGPGSPASYMMARTLEDGLRPRTALVCSAEAPAPFAPHLLDEVVATEERIVQAVRSLMS